MEDTPPKKNNFLLFFLIGGFVMLVIVGVVFGYFYMRAPVGTSERSAQNHNDGRSANSLASIDWDNVQISEDHVTSFLTNIGANNLQNPPFSGDTPKINVLIDSQEFQAEVIDKKLQVKMGLAQKPDIIIRTTREEAIKMFKDKNYISSSFGEGKSSVELMAGKPILFAKGYLGLYQKLTGKSAE